MRSFARSVLLGLLVLALLGAAAWRVVEVGVTEFYSPGWYSRSSADAQRRGLLIRRPAVVIEPATYRGAPLRVTDAWIERVTHVEHPFYLWRRVVRDPAVRLVVLARRDDAPAPAAWCDERPSEPHGGGLTSSGTMDRPEWTLQRKLSGDPPFPDTIRLTMDRRGDGCGGQGR